MLNDMPNCTWPGWETLEMIGRGSFGSVYKIRRNIFGNVETAALKVISIPRNHSDIQEMYSDGYNTESITKVFEGHMQNIVAEYSLMRKLSGNSNVVNCDDVRYVKHADGIGWDIFIKMELLTPLTSALPAQIPEDMAIKLGIDMCRALEMCNRHNILHRDIKPQNIFVSDVGDYKLGDFGIAKTVVQNMGGTRIGTPRYMAPEVFSAQPYGHTADIYSLGLVLYWMLNEKRMPFLPLPPVELQPGMEQDATYRRLSGEPLPPPAHGSRELKHIVMKACAFDPRYRYASATEMLTELQTLVYEQSAMGGWLDHSGAAENSGAETAAPPAENLDVRQTMDFTRRNNPAGKIIHVQVGNETKQVWIPKELQSGQTFYYEGMGRKSAYSDKRGDLYLTVRIDTPFDIPPASQKKKKRSWGSVAILCVIIVVAVLLLPKLMSGWRNINDKLYYYDRGKVTTGFVTIDGSKYLFDDQGVMQTGWHTIDGNTYYFGSDGVMATGSLKLIENGITRVYRFDSNGILRNFDATLVNFSVSKSAETITFPNAYGGFGSGHYWTLASAVQNTFSMKLRVSAGQETNGGSPDGIWSVRIRNLTGEWEHVGDFDVTDGTGTFDVTLDEPKTFDAYVCTKYSGDGWCGELEIELQEVSYHVYLEKQSLVKKVTNQQGLTTQVSYYAPDGELAAWYTIEYDENNVEQARIIHDNITGNKVKLVRNANGDYIIEENSGVNCSWIERELDSVGNLSSQIMYDDDGETMLYHSQYDYDEAGNTIAEHSYDTEGNLTGIARWMNEYDSHGRLKSTVIYDEYPGTDPKTYKTTYTYDVEGTQVGSARYENDHAIPYQIQSIRAIGDYFAQEITIVSYEGIWNGQESVFLYDEAHKNTCIYEEIYDEEGRLSMIIAWKRNADTVNFLYLTVHCYLEDHSVFVYSTPIK